MDILRKVSDWRHFHFYHKADALYQMTYVFTKRYLRVGDRTIDQMLQAARSGKQNIVEGSEDGKTSTEMELKLVNVARASIGELREDYEDYLKTRRLVMWDATHPRYEQMLKYCRANNHYKAYEPYMAQWNDEEIANVAITLCHMVDKMMTTHLLKLETDFKEEGGIKERMTASRLGFRATQKEEIAFLKAENEALKRKLKEIENKIGRLD